MRDALVIIDVQNAILDGTAPPDRIEAVHGYFNDMVTRLAALKAAAATAGIKTILVQNDGPVEHRLATGTKGWKIVPELAPNAQDIVVHKESCDSFHQTDLLEQLTQLNASRLIIGGCMTQFCIDTTVRRAVSLGFNVALIADGHCTGDAGELRQDQIIAHHNQTLNGFSAADNSVEVLPASGLFS